MQPANIRARLSTAEIKQIFDAADTSGDGTLSPNEFFKYTMSRMSEAHGERTILTAFARYDGDNSGKLGAREFRRACADLGFGAVADEIFAALDVEGTGFVAYTELIETLSVGEATADAKTRAMLTSMALSDRAGAAGGRGGDAMDEDGGGGLDTSSWVIYGKDVPSTRRELQDLLKRSGGHVADLLRLFDSDVTSDNLVDDMEFVRAMRERCGFRGSMQTLLAVFASLDTDNSGSVGFDELFEFCRGKRHSLDERNRKSRAMRLRPPPRATFTLDEIMWDGETLRLLLQQMLVTHGVSVAELMQAWDRNGDGRLSRREFLEEVRVYFQDLHPDLWESEVRQVAEEAFLQVDVELGLGFNALDLDTLSAWLSKPADQPISAAVTAKTSEMLHKMTARRLQRAEQGSAPPAPPTTAHKPKMRAQKTYHVAARANEGGWNRPQRPRSAAVQPRPVRASAMEGILEDVRGNLSAFSTLTDTDEANISPREPFAVRGFSPRGGSAAGKPINGRVDGAIPPRRHRSHGTIFLPPEASFDVRRGPAKSQQGRGAPAAAVGNAKLGTATNHARPVSAGPRPSMGTAIDAWYRPLEAVPTMYTRPCSASSIRVLHAGSSGDATRAEKGHHEAGAASASASSVAASTTTAGAGLAAGQQEQLEPRVTINSIPPRSTLPPRPVHAASRHQLLAPKREASRPTTHAMSPALSRLAQPPAWWAAHRIPPTHPTRRSASSSPTPLTVSASLPALSNLTSANIPALRGLYNISEAQLLKALQPAASSREYQYDQNGRRKAKAPIY